MKGNTMEAHTPFEGETVQKPEISIVLPVYNEKENVPALFDRLIKEMLRIQRPFEIIAVDDGSKDKSVEALRAVALKCKEVRIIEFKTNFGQTAALSAGIEHARGDIIVCIDSDLENDPADIARLLAKLEEGYDVVSGWRQNRWEGAFLTRRLPSRAANWLISRLTRVHLNDYGCTLKAYRSDVIKDVKLYGEMHRFVPAYAAWQGGRIAELPVNYQPRLHGRSNYGMSRIFRVLLDLIVIVFMRRYMSRPMHFFGGWGFAFLLFGGIAGTILIALKIASIPPPIDSLPILTALFTLAGIQLILFGVMAEILMRTYYESQHKRPYVIKKN